MLISLAHFTIDGHAQYITGPLASGAGGAGRAATEDGENVWLNPAALAHGSVFASAIYYAEGSVALNEHDKWWGASLADNSADIFFSGAFSYINREKKFANGTEVDEQYFQVGLSRFVRRHLSLGATFYYQMSELVMGQTSGQSYNSFDGHLGALYNPHPDFGFGLVFYNVGGRDNARPAEIQNYDKVSLGGLYIFREYFRVRADISQQMEVNPKNKAQHQVGLESKLAGFMMFRLGMDKNELDRRKYFTAGVSFDGPRAKVDYSYRKLNESGVGAMHSVDIRLPFW